MSTSRTREKADKVTFTQTEVTSAVALKAPIASPSFTGNIGMPNGSIDSQHIASMVASKLTGALPAISGASLTSVIASLTYNGGTTLSNLRIQTGSVTSPSSSSDSGTTYGTSARFYNITNITLSGFASTPTIFATAQTGHHEADVGAVTNSLSTTLAQLFSTCSRAVGIHSIPIHYIAIGKAS